MNHFDNADESLQRTARSRPPASVSRSKVRETGRALGERVKAERKILVQHNGSGRVGQRTWKPGIVVGDVSLPPQSRPGERVKDTNY